MKRLILAVVATLAVAAVPAVAFAMARSDAANGPTVQETLAQARMATAKYHDVDAAIADGYVQATDCIQNPGAGAMGIHFLNRAYAADPAIRADQPEELLYEPKSDGSLQLVGVEWFRPDADQNLATDEDRPSLAGIAFDGPMPGHSPGMPIHYDLHAWVWKANPTDTFNPWNPNVHC